MPNDPTPPLVIGRSLWAISPDALSGLIAAQRDGMPGLERLAARAGENPPAGDPAPADSRGVAVIPLTGILTPRASLLSMLFGGGGGLASFRVALRAALDADDVTAIVIDVDSPGGLTDLVPETAEEVRAARGRKPIIAVANTMAASAAYWIASQADELVITPSGQVGSIGTVVVHDDWSARHAQEGLVKTYITGGRYKADGNPDKALSMTAHADWQQKVDDLTELFVAGVAAGRSVSAETVRLNYGEGRTLLAQRALDAGMVDRIAPLEAVVNGLGGSIKPAASRPDNREHPMDDNVRQVLARQHGLDPDTATEDDINAAVVAADNPEATVAATPPEPEPEPAHDEPEPESTETVTLTAAQYSELQRGAEAGVAAQAALAQRTAAETEQGRAAERDAYLQTKVADGTLHRDDLPIYQLAYDRDGAKARERIDALSPGLVPALERQVPAEPGPSAALPDDGSVPEGLSVLTPAERAARA